MLKDGVSVGLYRLDELLEELPLLVRDNQVAFRSSVLVIDGPVGPAIEPVPGRAVDGLFSRGGFRNRAPAYPITHGSGVLLSNTSAQILHVLNAVIAVCPWLGGPLPEEGLIVAETNPTPALAMLLPQQDIATLPSRKHPKYINGALISAKSDWYWRLGAGEYAAWVLRDDSIAAENNHERVAGLFALALASELASGVSGSVVALGDKDGVYVVPAEVDQTWASDVNRIGVTHGQVTFVRKRLAVTDASAIQTLRVANVTVDERALEAEDVVLVVLNDNGGLNVAANRWLEEINAPCRLEAGDLSFTVEATFQGRKDMFRIRPSAKVLAKRLQFAGEHLSKDTPVTFQATIAST